MRNLDVRSIAFLTIAAASAIVACSAADSGTPSGHGGSAAKGGSAASTGTGSAAGGAGGSSSTGTGPSGTGGAGGSFGSGGSATGGSGATTGSGGSTSTGGTTGSGGSTSTGGTTGGGGSTSTGGTAGAPDGGAGSRSGGSGSGGAATGGSGGNTAGTGGIGGTSGGSGSGGAGGDVPPQPPVPPVVCKTSANKEPAILVGYQPAAGQTVGINGQIKVWVTDENPPFMAPGEIVDPATGTITTPGNRALKAPDGFPYEPALYISPQTAQNGGTPHFPQAVKGQYCTTPPTRCTVAPANVPIDPLPAGSPPLLKWTDEYVWEVSQLGLQPGSYAAEFWIFDGDVDRGIGCVIIDISLGITDTE